MKKKRFFTALAGLMVLILTLGILSGYGNNTENTSQPDTNTGKEITIAIYRDGDMNELDAASYNGPHVIYKMIYEGFVEDGGKDGIQSLLATSWDISEDGKTYTFHLREGVTFTDGTPFNAEAVCFNMKRWINNDRHSSLSSYKVESCTALDENTVQIQFAEGAYPILEEMTYPRPVRFLSPSSITGVDGDVMGEFTSPIGTGQWMLESYTENEEFVLVTNPNYWGEQPKISKITFKVIPDGQARVMALQSGEVDLIGGDLLGKIPMEGLQELKNSGYRIEELDTMCSYFMAFNQENENFQDVKVRQALNYAIDKKTMVENLFYGVGEAARGLYNSDNVPYVTKDNSPGYTYNLEKAKKLLEEAGYTDSNNDGILEKNGKDFNIKLVYTSEELPEWKTMAEYIQSEYAKIGVNVELSEVDTNTYNEISMTTFNFDMIMTRTSSDSWLPHGDMKQLFSVLSTGNRARIWLDDTLTENINQTLLCHDEDERQEGYDRIFTQINDEAFVVPLYYPKTCFAMTDKVTTFEPGVNNYAPINWTTLDVK